MTLTLLILIVLVNASARAFFYSSYQALVPELVDSRDLEHANGFLSATESGTEYLGGPIAGTTLFAVAKALPFFADALALVASCLPFARFRTKAAQRRTRRPRCGRECASSSQTSACGCSSF